MTDFSIPYSELEDSSFDLPAERPPLGSSGQFRIPGVPGYELLRPLGRGGMGVVFNARHLATGRPVAIKLLPDVDALDPKTVSRFLGEAQSIADVKHPNVVELFEVGAVADPGRDATVPFLAMELLEGGHLGEVLGGRGHDARTIASVLAKVCRGVAAAHAAGIVHRDLKPGNILFSRDGEPKVVDFGLAKRAISNLTLSVAVMGTPYYMSPEQAKGKSKSVGPPTDVWALGVILYQLLAGRPPFDAENQYSLLHQIVSEEPEPPRAHNADLPPVLEAIVLKCLAKQPERRFPTAAALATALDQFVAGDAVDVAEPAGPFRPGRFADRFRLALTLLLAASAGVCFLLWQREAAENRRYQERLTEDRP